MHSAYRSVLIAYFLIRHIYGGTMEIVIVLINDSIFI